MNTSTFLGLGALCGVTAFAGRRGFTSLGEDSQQITRTVGSAFGRVFGGPGGGLKATEEFQRATAESEALNGLLAKKQCT